MTCVTCQHSGHLCVLGLSGMDGSGRFQNVAVFLTDLMNKQTYMGRRGDLGGH